MSGWSMGPTCNSIWRVSWKGSESGISFQSNFGTPLSTVTSLSPALRATRKPPSVSMVAEVAFFSSKSISAMQREALPQLSTWPPLIVPDPHAHIGNIGFLPAR